MSGKSKIECSIPAQQSLVCGWRKELQRAGSLGGAESSLRKLHGNEQRNYSGAKFTNK